MKSKRAAAYSSGDWSQAVRAERWSKRTAAFSMLSISAGIGWLYVLFMSPLFMVNEVETSGLKTLDAMDVTREVFRVLDSREVGPEWLKRHMWFINESELEKQLKDRLFTAKVDVDKSYTSILRLSVEERSKRLIFHSKQQYLWVDLQGVVTDELSAEEKREAQARLLGQRLSRSDEAPIIKRNFDDPIGVGFTIADTREVREWLDLADQLSRDGMSYREVEPPKATSTRFSVLSRDGYDVIMDITTPIDLQVNTYNAFKSSGTKIKAVEYLDVRVPGRVTLKEK